MARREAVMIYDFGFTIYAVDFVRAFLVSLSALFPLTPNPESFRGNGEREEE